MTNTLETLAERLERAAGPDRELDEQIAVAIDPSDNARVIYGKGYRFHRPRRNRSPRSHNRGEAGGAE